MADDNVLDVDLNERLFGPQPDQPLEQPGIQGRDRMRAIAQQDPIGSATAEQTMAAQFASFSKADRARASALVQELAKLLRNTNITASQPANAKPSFWAEPIDLSAQIVVPAAVGLYTAVVNYVVPPGRYARIDAYGFDVAGGAYAYDGSLLWRMLVNGNPVYSLNNIAEHRGSIVQPRKTYFLAKEDFTVSFQVRRAVAALATDAVTMAFTGWIWPLRRNAEGTKAATTAY